MTVPFMALVVLIAFEVPRPAQVLQALEVWTGKNFGCFILASDNTQTAATPAREIKILLPQRLVPRGVDGCAQRMRLCSPRLRQFRIGTGIANIDKLALIGKVVEFDEMAGAMKILEVLKPQLQIRLSSDLRKLSRQARLERVLAGDTLFHEGQHRSGTVQLLMLVVGQATVKEDRVTQHIVGSRPGISGIVEAGNTIRAKVPLAEAQYFQPRLRV